MRQNVYFGQRTSIFSLESPALGISNAQAGPYNTNVPTRIVGFQKAEYPEGNPEKFQESSTLMLLTVYSFDT